MFCAVLGMCSRCQPPGGAGQPCAAQRPASGGRAGKVRAPGGPVQTAADCLPAVLMQAHVGVRLHNASQHFVCCPAAVTQDPAPEYWGPALCARTNADINLGLRLTRCAPATKQGVLSWASLLSGSMRICGRPLGFANALCRSAVARFDRKVVKRGDSGNGRAAASADNRATTLQELSRLPSLKEHAMPGGLSGSVLGHVPDQHEPLWACESLCTLPGGCASTHRAQSLTVSGHVTETLITSVSTSACQKKRAWHAARTCMHEGLSQVGHKTTSGGRSDRRQHGKAGGVPTDSGGGAGGATPEHGASARPGWAQ